MLMRRSRCRSTAMLLQPQLKPQVQVQVQVQLLGLAQGLGLGSNVGHLGYPSAAAAAAGC